MKRQKEYCRFIVLALILTSFTTTVYAAPSIGENEAKAKELAGIKKVANVQNDVSIAHQEGKGTFRINTVKIDTELKIENKALNAITKSYEGKNVDMTQLNELATNLTRYCRNHGYPAATAYVPEQKITEGRITLGILPGRIGKVNIENKSKLKDSTVQMLTARLKPGEVLTTKQVETALYTINDLGGLNAIGVLSAGQKVGTSDVTVRVEAGKGSSTILYAENYGTKAAGRYRYGLTEDLFNLGGRGGHFNAGVLLSNHDLHNYTVSYEETFGHSATSVGVGFSRMDYELGGIFSGLDANGTADTYSLYATTPLWRGTASSLQLTYGYDYKKLKDNLDKYNNMNAEKHSHALYLGLTGQSRSSASYSTYSLTGYTGMLGMDSDYANYLDAYNNTEGRWNKVVLDGSYVQRLDKTGNLDVYVRFQGQKASSNLDSSEKIFLGGANGVRAYPQGEGSGDEGFLATAELRYHTKFKGLTLSTYLDGGHVKASKDGAYGNSDYRPYKGPQTNH